MWSGSLLSFYLLRIVFILLKPFQIVQKCIEMEFAQYYLGMLGGKICVRLRMMRKKFGKNSNFISLLFATDLMLHIIPKLVMSTSNNFEFPRIQFWSHSCLLCFLSQPKESHDHMDHVIACN